MKIEIVIGAIVAVIVASGGIILLTQNKQTADNQHKSACADSCQSANQTCPALINHSTCLNKCDELSDQTKKHLQEASSCEQLSSKPELIADLLIPEMATSSPNQKNSSDCEAACGSYVGKCLTLVPNATPALFDEGLSSCMAECAGWKAEKVNCLITAFNCEAMTDVCGL